MLIFVTATTYHNIYDRLADRDAIWARIKQLWDRANLAYNAVRKGTETRQMKTAAGQEIVRIGRELVNLKFEPARRNTAYQHAREFYGSRGFRLPREEMQKVIKTALQGQNRKDANCIAAVWAYFAAAYNDLDVKSKFLGAKLIFSDKPDLYMHVEGQAPKAKRSRTVVERASVSRSPEQQYIALGLQRQSKSRSPEPEDPPGRRLQGFRSSMDYDD